MMYMKRATIIAATRDAKYVIPEEIDLVLYNAEGVPDIEKLLLETILCRLLGKS